MFSSDLEFDYIDSLLDKPLKDVLEGTGITGGKLAKYLAKSRQTGYNYLDKPAYKLGIIALNNTLARHLETLSDKELNWRSKISTLIEAIEPHAITATEYEYMESITAEDAEAEELRKTKDEELYTIESMLRQLSIKQLEEISNYISRMYGEFIN